MTLKPKDIVITCHKCDRKIARLKKFLMEGEIVTQLDFAFIDCDLHTQRNTLCPDCHISWFGPSTGHMITVQNGLFYPADFPTKSEIQ